MKRGKKGFAVCIRRGGMLITFVGVDGELCGG